MSDFTAKRCDGPRCTYVNEYADAPDSRWISIRKIAWDDGKISIILGAPIEEKERGSIVYIEIPLDFCGEGCLYRYLSQQLQLPASVGEETQIGSD